MTNDPRPLAMALSRRHFLHSAGYGLGLALAKKIVELNKGELSVSSAPGQLTTFKVLLPIFSIDKAKNK